VAWFAIIATGRPPVGMVATTFCGCACAAIAITAVVIAIEQRNSRLVGAFMTIFS
jgi:hypothetical protein